MIPGTPRRTAAYLAFYLVVAVLTLGFFLFMGLTRWAPSLIEISFAAGLPWRATVEPAGWRRMCVARNVALCAALLFSLVDFALLVAFTSFGGSGWQQ